MNLVARLTRLDRNAFYAGNHRSGASRDGQHAHCAKNRRLTTCRQVACRKRKWLRTMPTPGRLKEILTTGSCSMARNHEIQNHGTPGHVAIRYERHIVTGTAGRVSQHQSRFCRGRARVDQFRCDRSVSPKSHCPNQAPGNPMSLALGDRRAQPPASSGLAVKPHGPKALAFYLAKPPAHGSAYTSSLTHKGKPRSAAYSPKSSDRSDRTPPAGSW
jgi:hypothetical protein